MTTVIHLLGSDIPHHNHTVLQFFDRELQQQLPAQQPRQFWLVSAQTDIAHHYRELAVTRFASKKALAQAVIAHARTQRSMRFFCHGQFNPFLWLALLTGRIARAQCYWHIWGADLYEDATSLKFRLFYLLRRQAQKRVARVFATRGDIHYFHQRYPQVPASLLYFPTRLAQDVPLRQSQNGPLTILLGNSGDASNRHLQALQEIRDRFGADVQVIVPLGYPAHNQSYIQQIATAAAALFPAGQVQLQTDKLAFDDYLALIARCDLGYFIFERQQGIGTLCLLIQAGVPFVLNRQNPFWRDLTGQQVPFFFSDALPDAEQIHQAQTQLRQIDTQQIAFFAPGYLAGWQQALQQVEGDNL